MNRDFATQWDIERDIAEEAAREANRELFALRLEEINELAGQMMQGFVAERKDLNRYTKRHQITSFGLRTATYTDSDDFERIEQILATASLPQVCEAISELRKLMFEYCRLEAASYFGYDLIELEGE